MVAAGLLVLVPILRGNHSNRRGEGPGGAGPLGTGYWVRIGTQFVSGSMSKLISFGTNMIHALR